MSGPDVLYVTTYPPSRSELGGASWVDRRLLGALRGHARSVTVATITDERGDDERGVPVEPVGRAPLSIRHDRARLALTAAHMLVTRSPYQQLKFFDFDRVSHTIANLRSVAAGRRIVASGLPALMYAARAGAKVDVYVAHNAEWKVAEAHAPLPLRRLGEARRLERLEGELLSLPRQVAGLSRTDVHAFRELAVSATHLEVPLHHEPSAGDRARVGFLGNLEWPPNLQSLHTLVDRVWPRVRTRHPSAELVIAGRGSGAWTDDRAGIRGLGSLDDLDEFYGSVGLVAVPRLGPSTGISVKVLEAAERGVMAIVPPPLAEAIDVDHPWIVAASVESMAAGISGWLDDPGVASRRLRAWTARSRSSRVRDVLLGA